MTSETTPSGVTSNTVVLVLPTPEKLEEFNDELPANIVEALTAVANHQASDIAELAELISVDSCSVPLTNELVSLGAAKEIEYDKYFLVGRTTARPRLRSAIAFLLAVRGAALNASLGHDLEPSAVADLLKSFRVAAGMLLKIGAQESEKAKDEPWPAGTWPNGPW